MAWYPDAEQHPLSRHFVRGRMTHPISGLVLHITATHQPLANLFGDFNNPNQTGKLRSAHFGVARDGTIWQMVDTDDVAFAVDGVYGGNGVDNHWVSVENVGIDGEELTNDQVDTLAQLLAWLAHTEGVPLTLAEGKSDRGLGYHRMFHIGDHSCPGDKVIAQRQAILDTCSAAYI
jgi:N-acetyl-anhydromuramyl-L-alanine amidase AmpD